MAAAAAAAAACALLASVALGALGRDTADAATVLRSLARVEARLADGSQVFLSDGDDVPRGTTVRTPGQGSATLVTQGREVLLGSGTSVTVVDGAHQVLEQGLVLVDANDAPGLTVDGDAAHVSVQDDSLVRLERGPAALRVAVFEGGSGVRSAGRSGSRPVPELFQAQVPYGGLTGPSTPLVLTNDAWERRFALGLVQDDLALRTIASGLDAGTTESAAVLAAAPASVRDDGALSGPAASATPRSERLLGFLLARSAERGGDSVDERYATVRGYRQEGGSWGVVAALVAADAQGAARSLDDLLVPSLVALPGSRGGVAAGAGAVAGAVATVAPRPGSTPRRPVRGGEGQQPASPSPSATASPGPVEELVATVLELVPSPVQSVAGSVAGSPAPRPLRRTLESVAALLSQ